MIQSAIGAFLASIALLPAQATPVAGASNHVAPLLPAALSGAAELAALPDGGWLALDKNGLRLLDASGAQRAQFPIRARQLDTRSHAEGVLAVVVDSNTERAQPLVVNLERGTLKALPALSAPSFDVEASCLYRDAQRIDHLFLIGKDGQSEQWLLSGAQYRPVRKLALPPHVKHCRVDDVSNTLLAAESDFGLWAYRADAEGAGQRQAVALRAPYGKLAGGAGALSLLPGGAALLDKDGAKLYLFRQRDGQWQAAGSQQLAVKGGKGNALAVRADGGNAVSLTYKTAESSPWQARTLAWLTGDASLAVANTGGKVKHRNAPHAVATGAAVDAAIPFAIVEPRTQTDPMERQGDAADDPAIWLHPTNPAASRVFGTNKKQGLLAYDLQGKQTQLLESGRLNNVDIRQNVLFVGERFDLAAATRRDDNTLMLFAIDAKGDAAEAAVFPTTLEKIYGMCLYQPPGGALEAFVNDKDGRYQHYRIERSEGRFRAALLRSFVVASQPEGCVADDRSGRLFIGEEKLGVWSTAASAAKAEPLRMILPVGMALKADVEGMALYHGKKASYLVVSSQGDNSYVVLDAAAPHVVRGRFRIGMNVAAGVDGASETDGLDVTSANLGGPYAQGMLVVQDGYKRLPDGPQNFKYVAWDDIARALNLP
ncbi:phytase [Massilia sp. YIM B04103]|uniref:phytase n=1 Tax=Massilia sp. YIM B04103 TaxID=2963106 RepID=UPI00210EC674|nr:phytase [Massilia sp. YIM B04103]